MGGVSIKLKEDLTSLAIPGQATALAHAAGFLKNQVSYEPCSENPEHTVQVSPDGARVVGKIVGGKFEAL